MAASLIISAVVVLAIPNDFTAKMLEQQKMQNQAEEEKKMEQEESGKDMAINSTSKEP